MSVQDVRQPERLRWLAALHNGNKHFNSMLFVYHGGRRLCAVGYRLLGSGWLGSGWLKQLSNIPVLKTCHVMLSEIRVRRSIGFCLRSDTVNSASDSNHVG